MKLLLPLLLNLPGVFLQAVCNYWNGACYYFLSTKTLTKTVSYYNKHNKLSVQIVFFGQEAVASLVLIFRFHGLGEVIYTIHQ
uniref:Secreted protein n=1 Tax=Acrobeloides nanus TaxID=290746 RepID=A0A914C3U9_9BILA